VEVGLKQVTDHLAVAAVGEVLEQDHVAGDVRDEEARAFVITPDGTHDGLNGGSSTSITRWFFRCISGHGSRRR
jgi:hypothetical protein